MSAPASRSSAIRASPAAAPTVVYAYPPNYPAYAAPVPVARPSRRQAEKITNNQNTTITNNNDIEVTNTQTN